MAFRDITQANSFARFLFPVKVGYRAVQFSINVVNFSCKLETPAIDNLVTYS